ncbi:hypothetical protein CsatB_010490 [Cannabis sativa]|uniref:uncharacterized protein LOC133029958 n=1 Tax=Cannabis sativa TaxID=3483 RepID=UPI0029CA0054|nr:uncharacterized protein LOC133029958 [Cannabis sativa]
MNCLFCSSYIESSFHLFWDCIVAKSIWFGCSWCVRTSVPSISNWEEWIDWFTMSANRPPAMDLNCFLGGAAIIFESIWKERNSLLHGKQQTPLKVQVQYINSRFHEMNTIKESTNPPNMEWNPPPEGWIACNSDIAIGQSQATRAAVFRDTTGSILCVTTFRSTHCDPLPGEISAIIEGAAAAAKFGFKNVIFQNDSLNAVSALKSNTADIQKLHFNIQEKVKKFIDLSAEFNIHEIIWTPRSCNGVAHSVAQWENRNNIFGVLDIPNFDDFLQMIAADGHLSV